MFMSSVKNQTYSRGVLYFFVYLQWIITIIMYMCIIIYYFNHHKGLNDDRIYWENWNEKSSSIYSLRCTIHLLLIYVNSRIHASRKRTCNNYMNYYILNIMRSCYEIKLIKRLELVKNYSRSQFKTRDLYYICELEWFVLY